MKELDFEMHLRRQRPSTLVKGSGVGLQCIEGGSARREQTPGIGSREPLYLVLLRARSSHFREKSWQTARARPADRLRIAHGDRLSSPVRSAQDGSSVGTW